MRDGYVRLVGKGEALQLVEAHDPVPIGEQRVVTVLARQHRAVRVRQYSRAVPDEDDGAHHVIGVVVGENEPPHRRTGDRRDHGTKLLGLPRAPQCLDHGDAAVRDHEPGVRTPFRSSTGVTRYSVNARR